MRAALLAALLLVSSGTFAGSAEEGAGIEATSLLGRELRSPDLAPTVAAPHLWAIDQLRARLATNPGDAEARIWLGRRLAYLGRYRQAVAVFSEGVASHPDDARFLRHRGHRFLTLRRLEAAVADLEAGLLLVAGRPDEVEEDGLPNLFNRPTSTLKGNLLYHLGLARYLLGDSRRAGEAFAAGVAVADNPDMLVAATYWLHLSLRRQGRDQEAAALLRAPRLEAGLIENDDYQRLLRLFGGEGSPEALLARHPPGSVGAATLAYGIAAWRQLEGQRNESWQELEAIVGGEGWAAFGFLAAEADLARRGP